MSAFYALLFTVAFLVLVIGLTKKIIQYSRVPAPLKIPITPAPLTKGGVAIRLAKEAILFAALFRSNKWTWLFGWMFHMSLFVVLIIHLRYFIQDVPTWLVLLQPIGKYAAFTMFIGLTGLLVRRLFVARIKYISAPSDYLWLLMLMVIALTGIVMRFVSHTDIVAVKEFALGLIYFNWQTLPSDIVLWVHLFLVALLMILLPFSKLLHIPGLFFAPTRNQVDNPREKRHIAPWAAELDAEKNKVQPK
ncbi:respiratory nitrate reductase subunit gamma [sulfur-oxidizing endosymbiont of Gigantopelta aegis]|uniref:respiratory nitrate reductase subunit gamma n=1 Tax=sulfur-oxidizing endosymbiont of Gigantopelta aegis TaxID=2794934 RepID=UPI0018DEC354|nr:respiratory nitrate reductase subunit gamma [sulfur-oxidizing endosymbiont of Gigantopelta aegis]